MANPEEAAAGQDRPGIARPGRWLRARSHPRPDSARAPAILRVVIPLTITLIAATIFCFGLGFELARQADNDVETQHRRALAEAVEALHAVAPSLATDDPRLVRILEQTSGLRGLTFEDRPRGGDRAAQSVFDRNGRLIGWFSWEPERSATTAMIRLLPFAALIALGLAGTLGLAIWQLRRLGHKLWASEEQTRKLLHEEPVTGLSNRYDTLDRLDQALAERAEDQCLAYAIVALDGFRDAKDAVGEARGEEVLFEIAERLRAIMPADVIIGRGRTSDKFTLLMRATDAGAAFATAQAACEAIARPIWIGHAIHIRASVGLALAPRDGTSREELVRRADLALRAAQRRGGGLVVGFKPAMEVEFEERLFIKRELGRALSARDFDVHYQPIVKAEGGGIVGVEALLRWQHPTRGFIGPALFVPIAEQAGLMNELGEFVLRRALADAARWPDLYVAVNLSPMQVRDRQFVNQVAAILAETKVAPSRLVLEVTEGVLIDDPEAAKARLDDLRALGLKLALDDFGSGYSSLTYLQRLPFDKLKVDRGFVAALDRSANAGVIIQAIIALGRALNLTILVEGIETEEQRVLVRLAGCDEMQGFLFARPAPREEITRLLAGSGVLGGGAVAG